MNATKKLIEVQQQLKFPEHKLIVDVETRWNSTYYMMERLVEQQQAVVATLCFLDRSDLLLDSKDFDVLKEIIKLLKPFEVATREMSEEKHVSVSKIIPLCHNLQLLTSRTSSLAPKLAETVIISS